MLFFFPQDGVIVLRHLMTSLSERTELGTGSVVGCVVGGGILFVQGRQYLVLILIFTSL